VPGGGAGGELKPRRRERSDGVCWFFLRGECKNADNCRFSHSAAAVAAAREGGAGGAHQERHDRQQQPCRFFLAGNCNYGQNCNFLHVLPGEEQQGE
jgi:hypothetical protein